jgi:hypothetical protein
MTSLLLGQYTKAPQIKLRQASVIIPTAGKCRFDPQPYFWLWVDMISLFDVRNEIVVVARVGCSWEVMMLVPDVTLRQAS